MSPAPGLYVGTIRHRRFTPREHRFEYPLFMALLDVDRLRDAMSVSTFTSYNRWNWAAYHERDHLRDPSRPLRDRLRDSALAAGCVLPDGPVHLLTHLRYAGYVFNPISLFYCYDTGGELRLVLAEVSNTYGGRREYWLQPREGCEGFRAVAAKSLYVSPFMQQNADYEFVLTAPAASLVAHMNVVSREGAGPGRDRLFDATLTLDHRPWTARNLRHVLLRFPLMTASVITAIYWQALRLRLRGLKIFPFPQGGPV